ncbi:MAG: AAA family ATPase, partial [Leptospira sp.]|nr:AAA family ATPase [Leptospira sp.]
MNSVQIAGLKIPVYNQGNSNLVFPSNLVETDSVIKNLQNILYPMLEGYPLLLIGDAGVGKNALIYYINSKRNHPTLRFSFNEDTLPEDLIGSYRLSMDGHGFEWVNGPLTSALEGNFTFVADEMNLCSPEVIKRFATVYESNYLDLIEGDGSRKSAGNGFNFVATQNPSEGFEGRKSLPFDITKNYAVVYIDPYSPDEIFFILKKLYPDLDAAIIRSCIKITLETEKKIQIGQLGKGDLEKYHFNIRTLKKICERLIVFNSSDKDILFRELQNTFVETFRKKTDRDEVIEIIKSELSLKSTPEPRDVEFLVKDGTLFCNEKKIPVKDEKYSREALSRVPLTFKVREFLEKSLTAISQGENLLIEFADEHHPKLLSPLLSGVTGNSIEHVNLCKGIHTSDILGSLKPMSDGKVEWMDGPLTKGIRNGATILITGLEAAGAELVEKLNMLTDDARSITLPPESGELVPLKLQNASRIIALKSFRKTKSTSTISRAFRNRFTSVIFPDLEDEITIIDILKFYLPDSPLILQMASFHLKLKDLANRRVIGSANLLPYLFGISNIIRWKDHILSHNAPEIREVILRGAMISYVNQISDPRERDDIKRILEHTIDGKAIPDDLFQKIEEKKKTQTISTAIEKNKWWNPELHKRDANTGKAPLRNSGNPLKKGLEINTPETGGNTKEGADAWYGSETRGNMGQGEPAGGGGAWGWRTDELYKQFLAKRKILWSYSIAVSIAEFKEVFGKELDDVELNLEKLFDPEIDITRVYKT